MDSFKEHTKLLEQIVPILLENGLKSTTMDLVAGNLGMSKRTLYEIFGSKSEMIHAAFQCMQAQKHEKVVDAFATSDNVMEALIRIFRHNRDQINSINIEFYRDMDRLYKKNRAKFDDARQAHYDQMMAMFTRGVEEGMFREDVDFDVQARIMGLQMEALKRVEELFPPDITLQRVFDAIIVGFLRSIASPKGMEILDKSSLVEEIPVNSIHKELKK